MAGLLLSVLGIVGVVVAVVLLRGPEQAVLPDPGEPSGGAPSADPDAARADDAAELLERLGPALESGDAAELRALAAPGDQAARRELLTLRDNVAAMGIDDLRLRYVDEGGGRLSAERERTLGDRGWVGDVSLDWTMPGYDEGPGRREISVTFVQHDEGVSFVTARDDAGQSAPLWLLGRVRVQRTPQALVATAGSQRPARYVPLADQAVLDVRKVLPRWRGKLVVEVPATPQALGRVLGADPDAYSGIAAVTTTVDGTTTTSAPSHIYLNTAVFDPLGAQGAQVVMSHEATHVATDAATAELPTWLLEGFADYVALAHVDLPVSVTASQVLAQVREDGPPRALPGQGDFDSRNKALGATYESAWLACRLLEERYGERRLIEFYDATQRSGSAVEPFRDVLGTDEAAFTRSWRRYLRDLAAA